MSFRLAILAFAALAGASAATAQGMSLKAAVMQQRLVSENGKPVTKLVPASKVTPGDNVFYVLTFANPGARAATDVVLVNPIPANLEFVSAERGANVSVDGGKNYGQLAALKLASSDGKLRPALAADVTHVRWTLPPVAAGATGRVSFQARLK